MSPELKELLLNLQYLRLQYIIDNYYDVINCEAALDNVNTPISDDISHFCYCVYKSSNEYIIYMLKEYNMLTPKLKKELSLYILTGTRIELPKIYNGILKENN